ncbi:unnamed protein product [Effrenium voratum]|nr:unnamed protein product [Effrenium voratum]
MQGEVQEQAARSLLKEIASDGPAPRPLGRFEHVSSQQVEEALTALDDWKSKGRPGMPATYFSRTHKKNLKCFVRQQNANGTLDLRKQPTEPDPAKPVQLGSQLVHAEGDPTWLQRREEPGWYVPSLEVQEEWEEYIDEQGTSWWWNPRTGDHTYDNPTQR